MLITTIQELRLIYPNHAFDSIDGMVGFIDNSEHGFLEDKLGTPLYEALCKWYDENTVTRSSVADYQTGYWNRLLLMAQRCVGFDALGRAAGMQGVSVNNAGINQMIAEDYPKADSSAVDTYRKTAFTEALKSCDYMLAELERWTTAAATDAATAAASGDAATVPGGSPSGDDPAERAAIVALWAKSRYYYLAASMLIPSAVVLQQYLDFDESREKFIRMLPDLRYIQEEIIANAIGEEYLDHLINVSLRTAGDAAPITTKSPVELRIIHQLRRVIVAWLISRTKVIKYDKEQKIQAHDDGVRKMQDACDFIRSHQPDILEALGDDTSAFTASPLYVEPQPAASAVGGSPADNAAAGTVPAGSASGSSPCPCDSHCPDKGNLSMLVTPPLL